MDRTILYAHVDSIKRADGRSPRRHLEAKLALVAKQSSRADVLVLASDKGTFSDVPSRTQLPTP
jgi:hypothetical protein